MCEGSRPPVNEIERLTKAEIRELTGSTHRAKQAAWFAANGIPCTDDCHGAIVVLRAAVEARLMPKGSTRTPAKTGPDLSALPGRRAA